MMHTKIISALILLLFIGLNDIYSQIDTTVTNDAYIKIDSTTQFVNVEEIIDNEQLAEDSLRRISPKKAAYLSLACPGLGQIYNRKYWKVPIVWAALGTSIYAINFTYSTYITYIDDYIAIAINSEATVQNSEGYNTLTKLKEEKLRWRKYRDYSVLAFVGVYLLNVIDANVDAHFYNFDVSEDLSLRISPAINYNYWCYNNNYNLGLNLRVYF